MSGRGASWRTSSGSRGCSTDSRSRFAGMIDDILAEVSASSSARMSSIMPANLLRLSVEQPVLPDEVRQLAPRPDAQLEKNVREVGAHRACRDLKCAPDFLVGLPGCNHPRYFQLPAGQSG